MAISTNQKPTIYRNLYEITGLDAEALEIYISGIDPLGYPPRCLIKMFTHLKMCLATATHNFKWVKITLIRLISEFKHILHSNNSD